MANAVYNGFKVRLLLGYLNLGGPGLGNTGMVMLVGPGYVISQGEAVTGDVTNEIVSVGYKAGGLEILQRNLSFMSNGSLAWTGMPVTWTGITANPRYGIVYISGSTPSTSYVVGQVDLGQQSITASDFTINWNQGVIYEI